MGLGTLVNAGFFWFNVTFLFYFCPLHERLALCNVQSCNILIRHLLNHV